MIWSCLGFFVGEGVDAKEVSPEIELDFCPDKVVTRAFSSTKLLDLLQSDDSLQANDLFPTVKVSA